MITQASRVAMNEDSGTGLSALRVDAGRAAPEASTPMMTQYTRIKAAHPGCLLFYRMGDFFELFFEDAVAASRALGIQLTKRGKHQGDDIPMCGVPVIRADEYLQKLIAAGFRIARAEDLVPTMKKALTTSAPTTISETIASARRASATRT